VQFAALADDPRRPFVRLAAARGLLLRRLDHLRQHAVRDQHVGEVVHRKVVGQAVLRQSERRHSDTSDEEEHVDAVEPRQSGQQRLDLLQRAEVDLVVLKEGRRRGHLFRDV